MGPVLLQYRVDVKYNLVEFFNISLMWPIYNGLPGFLKKCITFLVFDVKLK